MDTKTYFIGSQVFINYKLFILQIYEGTERKKLDWHQVTTDILIFTLNRSCNGF